LNLHMQVASSDGVAVAVHDLGGEGEPFLICHATGFCGCAYEPMAARLAEQHHVWALDFRGHGDTLAPENGRFDWSGMADDLEAVITALTSSPLRVFGHSMGGAVAVMVEHRKPGKLKSAYLYEPIIVPASGEMPLGENPMSEIARHRRPAFPSKADALMRYASRPPLNVLQAGALAAYVEHGFTDEPDGSVRLKCRPEYEAATFAATGKATVEMAANVLTPTTVAIGHTTGDWGPALFAPAVVEAMPNAQLERFEMLGHFGPLQDPVAIANAILARENGVGR
jgi:pimeloyl-ACP methyl ester carboxylesterase